MKKRYNAAAMWPNTMYFNALISPQNGLKNVKNQCIDFQNPHSDIDLPSLLQYNILVLCSITILYNIVRYSRVYWNTAIVQESSGVCIGRYSQGISLSYCEICIDCGGVFLFLNLLLNYWKSSHWHTSTHTHTHSLPHSLIDIFY